MGVRAGRLQEIGFRWCIGCNFRRYRRFGIVPATVRSMTSSQFLPHVYCYLYDKQLIALHMSADALIWLSYVAIALTLTYMVRRARREIPFSWLFLAFGTFIIACGFTHFMEMWFSGSHSIGWPGISSC